MSEATLSLKQLRLIQIGLIIATIVFATIAEIGRGPGSDEWTGRDWMVAGLALWLISGGFTVRRRISRRLAKLPEQERSDEKIIRMERTGQLFRLGVAQSVASWGMVVRMVLHGALWQASIFYAVGLFLLLLWTPRS
jgi:hypothetical protein